MREMALWALLACLGCADAPEHDGMDADAEDGVVAEIAADALVEALAEVSCPGSRIPAEGSALMGHGDCFEAIAAASTVQMVRGIQGGIHVEVRLGVRTAIAKPELTFEVDVVQAGTSLARFSAMNVSLQPLAASGEWATASFPVVFASADSSIYHGLHVELRAVATLSGHPLDVEPVPIVLAAPPGEVPP